MVTARPMMTTHEFAKTFAVPALLIFVIPIISWFFFRYAQAVYDRNVRDLVQAQIRAATDLTNDQREKAIEFFDKTPFSQQLLDPAVAQNTDSELRFSYTTFRWMIRLSAISVISGIAVFLFAGLCVWFSLRSQFVQYYCLLASWHVLRIYGAMQTIVIAVLVVALSYWATAILFEMYIAKLIFLAAIVAFAGVVVVIKAIFTSPKVDSTIEGIVLKPEESAPLWQELKSICDKVGTSPPDQIIAGIDDNFFVTEQPLTVKGTVYQGKSLFVSLPLLKQLHTSEATSIIAHEMAHFSGNDTLYSRKITPLIQRYNNYLGGLYETPITRPIFHFMVFFRALFDLSLSKLSREREFRADAISASVTSERDFASALLRTVAYSKFRHSIEMELFEQQQQLATVDISNRIEKGFVDSLSEFVNDPLISQAETAHPFDTHPSLSQRLNHLGIDLNPERIQELLKTNADGGWYSRISEADKLELQMWNAFEQEFQKFHTQTLAYRFLPETPEEQIVVEQFFPSLTFETKAGPIEMDFAKIQSPDWHDAVYFRDVDRCEFRDDRMLVIHFSRVGKRSREINVKKITKPNYQEFLIAFQNYHGRYLAAVDYQKQSKATAKGRSAPAEDTPAPSSPGTDENAAHDSIGE